MSDILFELCTIYFFTCLLPFSISLMNEPENDLTTYNIILTLHRKVPITLVDFTFTPEHVFPFKAKILSLRSPT